jgi:hypothetical protein
VIVLDDCAKVGRCGLPLSRKSLDGGSHQEDWKMRASADKFLLIQPREGF